MVVMNCSAIDTSLGNASSESVSNDDPITRCTECKGKATPVSRKTVLLMLKSHLLEQAMPGSYSFCAASDCDVVYFAKQGGHSFATDDLRIRVGVKVKIDPIPVCYCFGFDESHIREEISTLGETTVPAKILKLIREGLCACDTRNPAGVCCLGEINRTVKRLSTNR